MEFIYFRMSNHWSYRLKSACADKGLTYAEIARSTGISEDSINKYAQGAVDQPRGTTMDILARVLGVSKLWLLYGIDETSDQQTTDRSRDILNIPAYAFKAGMGGGGVITDEKPTDYWPVPRVYLRHIRLETADLATLTVEGDSMSPTLESGDQILINKTDKNPARGGIFAIHDSNTLVVKRVEKIPGTDPVLLRLISDNQNHGAYDVLAQDTAIIGRVVWFARRI